MNEERAINLLHHATETLWALILDGAKGNIQLSEEWKRRLSNSHAILEEETAALENERAADPEQS